MKEIRLGDWSEWPLDPVSILEALERHGVAYVVVGGLAAVLHGSPLPTYDLDITPRAALGNCDALLGALVELGALLLSDEAGREPAPVEHVGALEGDASFYTAFGYVDVVFRPAGTNGYGELSRGSTRLEVAPGVAVPVARLRDVVRSKETLRRERDLAQLPALHALLELAPA